MAMMESAPSSVPANRATEADFESNERLQLEGGVSLSVAAPERGPEYDNVTLLPMPKYHTEIDTSYRKSLHAEEKSYGKFWIEEWRDSEGTYFDVGKFEPKRVRTDVALVEDTSLTTQVLGFNTHGALGAMRLGMRALIKGPEKNKSIRQSQSAHNTHAMLNVTDAEGFSQPKIAIVKGFSRGAMLGMGTNAYSESFGRHILYSDLTDPCLARAVKDMGLLEMLGYVQYLPHETIGSTRMLTRIMLNPKLRKHYMKTVDVSPKGAKQVWLNGAPLMNGEAGFMAERVPMDAEMHIRFFKGSLPNMRNDFKRRLAGRPGVVFEDRDGIHTSGANQETRLNTSGRLSGLVLQLSMGVKPEDIDFSLVHLTAEEVHFG